MQHRKYFSQPSIYYTTGHIIRFIIFCSDPSTYSDVNTIEQVRQLYTSYEQQPAISNSSALFILKVNFWVRLWVLDPLSAALLLWVCVWNPSEIYLFFSFLKTLFLPKPADCKTLYKALGFGLVVRTLCIKSWYNLVKKYFHFVIKPFTWS